jgi:hypothetical protein
VAEQQVSVKYRCTTCSHSEGYYDNHGLPGAGEWVWDCALQVDDEAVGVSQDCHEWSPTIPGNCERHGIFDPHWGCEACMGEDTL